MSESRLFGAEPTTDPSYSRLFALSSGGMGEVELTVRHDGRFRRLYAVKRMLPALRHDASSREMFLEEARLAGLIHSPNVIGVLDVGEDDDGPFLAMEYVDGVTVREIILQAREEALLLPIQLCCQIVSQAARGLEAAHSARSLEGEVLRLVHRDVSPQNILVGFDGIARVVDFGIARALGREHKTSTGILKGKLGYMAPETLHFEKPDARSDIFGLGVVLFEVVTGERLYGGDDDAERARRIVGEDPPQLSEYREDVPPALEALVIAMLAKERTLRPASAKSVAERLEAIERELQADEGDMDVAGHLEEAFGEMRETRQQRITRELDNLKTKDGVLESVSTPKSSHPSQRGRGWLFMVGAVFVAASAALFLYANANGADHTEPRTVHEAGGTTRSSVSAPVAVDLPQTEAAPAGENETDEIDVPPPRRPRRQSMRTSMRTQMREQSMRAQSMQAGRTPEAMTEVPTRNTQDQPPSWDFE